jgi:hypothetical protein
MFANIEPMGLSYTHTYIHTLHMPVIHLEWLKNSILLTQDGSYSMKIDTKQ